MKAFAVFLLSSLLSLVGRIPLRIRTVLGARIGACVARLSSRDREIASLQLDAVAGMPSPAELAVGVFKSLGSTALESIALHRDVESIATSAEWDDQGIVADVARRRPPMVTLTGHLGNWEVLAAVMVFRGIQVVTIARPARNDIAQRLIKRIRNQYGIRVIWRGGRSTIREVVRELHSRQVVAALIDQDIAGGATWVPFFGKPVRVPTALIEAGRQAGAEFTSAFVVRVGPGKFRVSVRRISPSLSAEEIAREYHSHLESLIREFPEQWVWIHKRWRSREDGERMSSKEYQRWLTMLKNQSNETL